MQLQRESFGVRLVAILLAVIYSRTLTRTTRNVDAAGSIEDDRIDILLGSG